MIIWTLVRTIWLQVVFFGRGRGCIFFKETFKSFGYNHSFWGRVFFQGNLFSSCNFCVVHGFLRLQCKNTPINHCYKNLPSGDVHLHGVVDHQVGRTDWVYFLWITSQTLHRVPHSGEINHGWYTTKKQSHRQKYCSKSLAKGANKVSQAIVGKIPHLRQSKIFWYFCEHYPWIAFYIWMWPLIIFTSDLIITL